MRNGNQTPSSIDVSPDYLHIHLLKSKYLASLDDFVTSLAGDSIDNNLYQWGIPLDKLAKTRSVKVSAEDIKQKGQIGIGSAARGYNEDSGDFIGGGEAFLSGSQNFRITKGDGVFEVKDDQGYWIFQTSNFNNHHKIDDLRGQVFAGRFALMEVLKNKSSGKPFVATFDAFFNENFFVRSNGILPEDHAFVKDPNLTLFDAEMNGGHLLGGHENAGDMSSLQERFSQEVDLDPNFSCQIVSSVFLKPIDEVKIAKRNGDFRSPRTEFEVNRAAQLVQGAWKKHKTK